MPVSWVAPVKRKDIGVIQIVDKDRDKDILDLQDRVPDEYHMHHKAIS